MPEEVFGEVIRPGGAPFDIRKLQGRIERSKDAVQKKKPEQLVGTKIWVGYPSSDLGFKAVYPLEPIKLVAA